MNQSSVACPLCRRQGRRILIPAEKEGRVEAACPCRKNSPVHYVRFPALDRMQEVPEAAHVQLEDDASCFHHPDRQAKAVCVDCGIFICELCEVKDVDGNPLCLTCYSRQTQNELNTAGGSASTDGQMVWDRVALALAVFPLLIAYFVIVTAPMTLYIVFRHWKGHPYSYIPSSRIRFVMAAAIALLQIGGLIAVITSLVVSV